MDWKQPVLCFATVGFSVGASAAQTAYPALQTLNTGSCSIDHAARIGDAVKVVFVKGVEPEGAIIRAGGSKTFFNGVYMEKVKSRYLVVLRNPRSFVILHEGDKLGIIGMDDGCTATLVRVRGVLELEMHWGLPSPHIPGVKQHAYTTFIPVAGGK